MTALIIAFAILVVFYTMTTEHEAKVFLERVMLLAVVGSVALAVINYFAYGKVFL